MSKTKVPSYITVIATSFIMSDSIMRIKELVVEGVISADMDQSDAAPEIPGASLND